MASQVDKKIVNPVEKFLGNLVEEDGLLPANHHLERGTYRAAVLASLLCVKRVRPSAKLMHPRGKVEDYRYYGARDQLLLRLKRLEQNLQPASETGLVAKVLGKPSQAHAECAALLQDAGAHSAAPALDAAGMRALALQNASEIEGAPNSPRDFTELRLLWTPNLPTHLCTTLATWGAWPKDRQLEIAGILEETFFGQNELWLNSFAYFYVEEIRQDPELHVTATILQAETAQQVLERIDSGTTALRNDAMRLSKNFDERFSEIKAGISEIKDSVDVITDLLHRIQDQSNLRRREIYFRPSSSDDGFKQFHFSEEEEDFVGRETTLDWLSNQVLLTDDPFAWAAISGPAGMGKSRLAFHIMNESLQHFRHGGFVNESAILDPLSSLPSSDEIDGPTLLIIDYAGSAPENCAKFLARCALVSSGAAYPVRALVLVRRPDDEFFSQVANGREYGQLRKTQIKYDDPRSLNGEVALTPLDEDDILKLVRSRIASTAVMQAKEIGASEVDIRSLTDEQLKSALKQYGADEGRPLYALIIADGLQRGMEVLRGQGETIEEARLHLLWDYLSGQYYRRWEPASRSDVSGDTAGEKLDRHLSFAVLSTFCRGLTDKSWQLLFEDKSLSEDANLLLPAHRRHRKDAGPGARMDEHRLLPSIVGARRSAQEKIYPAIEPDLIGEALLLGLFHDVGENWGQMSGTVEDRRDFLIDLAWCADPSGAAYFANLVAQDFPKTAEASGWLLPKIARKEHELPRARLLRNVASITLSGFREKAATMEDIRRIDRLIRLFDFSEDVAEEAIAQYSQALVAIAEELAFVINKSGLPSKQLHAEPLYDPQKSESRRKFERASTKPVAGTIAQFQVSETAIAQASPAEILKRTSDDKTVEQTIRVLKRLFRTVANYLERGYSFDIRASLFETLSWALTSVYWESRNDRKKFGYAPTGLSEKEKAERSAFLLDIEGLIQSQEPDEETMGLIAGVLYSALYAEAGTKSDRGDELYRVVHDFAAAGVFSHAGALSKCASFLRNYSVNQRERDAKCHTFGENHNEQVAGCIEQLFNHAVGLQGIVGKDWDRIVSSFLDVSLSGELRKPNSLGKRANLQPAMQKLLRFCERHGFQPLDRDAVQFISLFSSTTSSSDVESLGYLQQILELVEETGFNKQKLNNPIWKYLPWCLLNFMRCSPEVWPTSKALVMRLVSDVGTRAKDDLLQILTNTNSLDGIAAERGTDIVPALENKPLDKAQIRLGLLGKALQDNNDIHLVNELKRWWTIETNEEAITQRTFALQIVLLLLPWRGAGDAELASYRSFVLEAFQNGVESELEDVGDTMRHYYCSALSEVASMFAKLEIANGAVPDVWIEAVKATNG